MELTVLVVSSNVPGIRLITAELYSFRLTLHSGYPFTTLLILRRIGGSIPKVEQRNQTWTSPYPVTSLLGNRLLHLQRDATHSEPPQSLHMVSSSFSCYDCCVYWKVYPVAIAINFEQIIRISPWGWCSTDRNM